MLQPFASTVYALIEQFLTTYVYVRTFVAAMAQANEQPDKRQMLLCADADGADQYLHPNQPGRVLAQQISWLHHNRGGHGLMHMHAQDIARDTYFHVRDI